MFSPSPAQKISIAITIAFENRLQINQTLIFIFQPDFDFYFSIKPRLKFFNQTLIEKRASGSCCRRGIPFWIYADLFNFLQSYLD